MTPDEGPVDFYRENGFLRVPAVFSPEETDELAEDLDRLIQEWSFEAAWTGPWRDAYLTPELAGTIKLSALHDLHLYSAAWARAVVHPGSLRRWRRCSVRPWSSTTPPCT